MKHPILKVHQKWVPKFARLPQHITPTWRKWSEKLHFSDRTSNLQSDSLLPPPSPENEKFSFFSQEFRIAMW